MISPETRFTAVLLGSLLVWSPALRAALAGELPTEDALFRFVLTLGAVWLMVAGLDRVVGGYARTAAATAAAAAVPEPPPRRRKADAPAEDLHTVANGTTHEATDEPGD